MKKPVRIQNLTGFFYDPCMATNQVVKVHFEGVIANYYSSI